jgi:hypothetical protein
MRARILYVLVTAAGAGSSSLLVLLFARGAGLGKVEAFLAAVPLVTVSTFAARAQTRALRLPASAS